MQNVRLKRWYSHQTFDTNCPRIYISFFVFSEFKGRADGHIIDSQKSMPFKLLFTYL